MKKNRTWGDRTQEPARYGRASAGRATALVAIALVAASALSGCSSLYSEAAVTGAGIAGAGIANSVTSNAAVATGIGLGAVAAARAGHDAVLAPNGTTYFDHYQSRDTANEPLAIGGFLPLDQVYTWEPMPPALEPSFQSHILGVQAQLWTEYLPDPKAVEYMAFPRLSALAEVAWSPAASKNADDFHARLTTHEERLTAMDVNFRK